MLALQEGHLSSWTAGRVVCLGDSVHKMTPHAGSGSMLCIETAASLANSLSHLAMIMNAKTATNSPPTLSQVEEALRQYESGPNNFHRRAPENIRVSNDLGRLSALRTLKDRFIMRYLVPISADNRIDMFCDISIGAPCIDYLPVPPRSMAGTMPLYPAHGTGKREIPWLRALISLPLVVLAALSFVLVIGLVPFDEIRELLLQGVYRPKNSQARVRILQGLYRVSFIDHFTLPDNLDFVVSSPNCLLLMLCFWADYGVWYAITLMESAGRANHVTILEPVFVWGILNMRGIALFGALYKFVHYFLSPVSVFDAPDLRLTDKAFTAMVIPALLTTYYATYISAYFAANPTRRQITGYLWSLFPLWIWLGQKIAVRYILRPCTVNHDRLYNVTNDLGAIRRTVVLLVTAPTVSWQYVVWSSTNSSSSLADVFLPTWPVPSVGDLGLDGAYVEFLKWDWVFFVLSNVVWILLLAWDLKAAGMVRMGWLRLVLCGFVLDLIGGPGILTGVAWLYREEVLVKRKHKEAVIPKSE